ncbi:MAG: hypothetical protein ABI333_09770 [bacterium]
MSSIPIPLPVNGPREARISELQAQLRARFPAAAPVLARPETVLSTGVDALDRLLPHGGLPRGQVTEWVAARSGGSATLLRQLVWRTVQREKVALVDAGRTLAAADWVEVAPAGSDALTFVRPSDPRDGPWCADLLLRTGLFALVVLDGAAPPRQAAQRFAHLARESSSALLVVLPSDAGRRGGGAALASVRLQLTPTSPTLTGRNTTPPRTAPMTAALIKGGTPAQVEVPRETVPTHRLCAHPLVPDRRGGARRGRSW